MLRPGSRRSFKAPPHRATAAAPKSAWPPATAYLTAPQVTTRYGWRCPQAYGEESLGDGDGAGLGGFGPLPKRLRPAAEAAGFCDSPLLADSSEMRCWLVTEP